MATANQPFNATTQGQTALFYQSSENVARANETFMVLVNSGMTRSDLERCIQMRPALWKRFEHWLDKLPTTRPLRRQAA